MANDQYPDAAELARRRSSNQVPSAPGRPSGTRPAGRGGDGSRIAPSAPRPAAQVARLAARLGRDAEEFARALPPDTLRRLRYPLIERKQEDGTRTYDHDLGITEGVRTLTRP